MMLGKDAGGNDDGGEQGAAAEDRWPLPSYVFDLPTSHLLATMMIFLKNIVALCSQYFARYILRA